MTKFQSPWIIKIRCSIYTFFLSINHPNYFYITSSTGEWKVMLFNAFQLSYCREDSPSVNMPSSSLANKVKIQSFRQLSSLILSLIRITIKMPWTVLQSHAEGLIVFSRWQKMSQMCVTLEIPLIWSDQRYQMDHWTMKSGL